MHAVCITMKAHIQFFYLELCLLAKLNEVKACILILHRRTVKYRDFKELACLRTAPPRGHTSTLSCAEALAAATGMLPWNNSPTAAAKAPVALAAVICRADMATNCAVVLPALGSAYQATVPVCESSMVMLHLHISSWHHAGDRLQ